MSAHLADLEHQFRESAVQRVNPLAQRCTLAGSQLTGLARAEAQTGNHGGAGNAGHGEKFLFHISDEFLFCRKYTNYFSIGNGWKPKDSSFKRHHLFPSLIIINFYSISIRYLKRNLRLKINLDIENILE
jgi:hypothetical protein